MTEVLACQKCTPNWGIVFTHYWENAKLDVIIADAPKPTGIGVKVYNHFLGECGITFFAAPELAKKLASEFPECLNGFPMLLPMEMTTLREMV